MYFVSSIHTCAGVEETQHWEQLEDTSEGSTQSKIPFQNKSIKPIFPERLCILEGQVKQAHHCSQRESSDMNTDLRLEFRSLTRCSCFTLRMKGGEFHTFVLVLMANYSKSDPSSERSLVYLCHPLVDSLQKNK